ncbi:M4 family metallopeptidase [Deinococcus cellulosilyticus]|uniref:Peptidase M4 C-terminal domain-containing protein n=1 Tax=Deinococcus cellulosilyticus (strain DSM 18568 / NBRC 106333 / KACC 11606 / 5516J-15) TaxID=1223518 RepID=A0A511NAT3_DEIC1|nr:M4 family metallopeptidase [Deinococcus cellulosilyticus]GEM49687.1 hypothetical protein DC3_53220 [Deinococcus cellulosilyticus NBRC 106333 = KACC 11606]
MTRRYTMMACALLLSACNSTQNQTGFTSQKLAGGPATANAQVFLPNPVQTTGDQTLQDSKDADSAVPSSAYYKVVLTDLDGSGTLQGKWATVRSETGKPVQVTSAPLNYTRSSDQFEQVMAYFWITEAQKYIQSLGFGTGELPPVNMESQDVRINQWGQDNSYSIDTKDEIRLGKGGVDDAEDGEVIVHEYGHAVHDAQVTGFGSSLEAGAIGEAFGDYLALTVGEAVAKKYGAPIKADLACIADWDSVSYTNAPHCLRRTDKNKTIADQVGQVHADGEIWSRALFDIRKALGAYKADRVIINAQFKFAPDTSFNAAAKATVDTAQSMYGTTAATAVKNAFLARGMQP